MAAPRERGNLEVEITHCIETHLARLLSEHNGISSMYTSPSPLDFALKRAANDCFSNVASQGRFPKAFRNAVLGFIIYRRLRISRLWLQ